MYFFPIIQEYIALYFSDLFISRNLFPIRRATHIQSLATGWEIFDLSFRPREKLFQNQCCLSLERSFDLETSKAPMVLEGGKPKGGGHSTLIYLTFISTKIRHVLASLSDIQQQHRCLAMHCNAASSFMPEFPSSTGTQLRHYSLIITESLQVSMLVAFLPKLATELNYLPT